MGRGGARKGAGRKKVEPEAKAAPNKARASQILEGLSLTDEEWKKKGHVDQNPPPYPEPDAKLYSTPRDFIQAHYDWELAKRCQCEDCLWRRDAQRDRGAREYLWNRRDGHAVRVINHIHDKPLDLNVTVSMAEIVREVRHRKQEYERNRKRPAD